MVAAIPYMVGPCMALAGRCEVPESEDITIHALCLPSLQETVPVHCLTGRQVQSEGVLPILWPPLEQVPPLPLLRRLG